MSFVQIVKPRLGTVDGLGWCLRFTQTVFSAPVKYPSAREAWDHQAGRHVGEPPPEGVIVPVWFDHTGTYGNPPTRKNWGHVAVSLGDGRYLTSPMNILQGGQATYPSLLALMRALGGNPRYLGWSESMNGKQVVRKVVADQPASTPGSGTATDINLALREEQEHTMVHVFARNDGGKDGEYMRVDPQIGAGLKKGEKRVEGAVTVFRGYEVTKNSTVGKAWGRTHARAYGNAPSRLTRADYIAVQEQATRHSLEVA